MNRTLTIPLYMRAILLSEICRRIDTIAYCNRRMGLELKETKKMIYSGTCPWCREKERFFFHRGTGYCVCESCEKIADFFDMVAIGNGGAGNGGARNGGASAGGGI